MEKCLEILEKIDNKKQTEFSGVNSEFFKVNSNFFGVGSSADGEKYETAWKLDHYKQTEFTE